MVSVPVANRNAEIYKADVPGKEYAGVNFDGVGFFRIGSIIGTAALIGKEYIITAAHNFGDDRKAADGSVTFEVVSENSSSHEVKFTADHVRFIGNTDLAIIKLNKTAPLNVDSYDFYTRTDEIGKTFVHVGYGAPGTGYEGATLNNGVPVFPLDGIKRWGLNTYDDTSLCRVLSAGRL